MDKAQAGVRLVKRNARFQVADVQGDVGQYRIHGHWSISLVIRTYLKIEWHLIKQLIETTA